MQKIILTTEEELEAVIHVTLDKILKDHLGRTSITKNDIMSIQDACQYLNLAKQTLYGFTSKNEIPFFKRGKKLYFRKSELEEWLTAGKQKTLKETREEAISYINKSSK